MQRKSGVKVVFEYINRKGRLYSYTPVTPVPLEESRRLALYEAMLDCNFLNLGCETGGLAIFRHTGQTVYQLGLEVKSLNIDRLNKAIKELLDRRDEFISAGAFKGRKRKASPGSPARRKQIQPARDADAAAVRASAAAAGWVGIGRSFPFNAGLIYGVRLD